MQILMLITDGYGCSGGISKYNRDLLASLSSNSRVETVRVWPRNVMEPIVETIPEAVVYERRFAGGKWRYAVNAILSQFSGPSCDLVICAHLHLLPIAWVTAVRRRAVLALLVFGVDAWKPTASSITNVLAGRIDWLISISDITERRFRSWAQANTARSIRIPPSVDLDRFQPGARPAALIERYRLSGRRVLLTLGRLDARERYKGVDEILEVLPLLIAKMPDIRYLVVGDGDDRARLQEKAHTLGLGDFVVFSGRISDEEKVDHYRLADVFVMPSHGEGFGIVLIEAAATGAKLIGSTIDGTREALLDGVLGDLVDPAQPDALHDAIVRALDPPTPRRRHASIETFSREAFDRRVADWLSTMCRQS